MKESQYLHLEPIETAVAGAAAQIYAAYVSAGRVAEGSELGWMARAVDEAVSIAQMVDERVLAKAEIG